MANRTGRKDGRSRNGGRRPGSGRKKGSPNKVGKDLRALAQPHTAEALAVLVAIMNDTKAPPQARATAADRVLDRAWGKPSQAVVGDPENPVQLKTRIELIIVDPKGRE
jgi:hypothetical protein